MSAIEASPLPGMYQRMADDFIHSGLNVSAVEAMLEWFDDGSQHEDGVPRPKLYVDFDDPLPRSCVRLLVLPVNSSQQLERAGSDITAEIRGLLQPQAKVSRRGVRCIALAFVVYPDVVLLW